MELWELHKDVAGRISVRCQTSIAGHNTVTNIFMVRFEVVDFVVVCHPTRSKYKLSFLWCGPRQVVAVTTPVVCVVQDLIFL